jgi:hypothetical protein
MKLLNLLYVSQVSGLALTGQEREFELVGITTFTQ